MVAFLTVVANVNETLSFFAFAKSCRLNYLFSELLLS